MVICVFYLHSNAKLLILQTGFLQSFAAAFHKKDFKK